MSLFKHTDPYTAEQIAQQVTNLEKLHKQRDMVTQKMVLMMNSKDVRAPGMVNVLDAEVSNYSRSIESGMRYLQYMQNRNAGVKG